MLITTIACIKFIALAGFIICFAYAWYNIAKLAHETQEALLRQQVRFDRVLKAYKVLYKKYKAVDAYRAYEEQYVHNRIRRPVVRPYKDHWPQPNGTPPVRVAPFS